jgi:hypothetical protein
MSSVAQLSYRVPIGTDVEGRPVLATRAFFDFADDVFRRIGGASAPTLIEVITRANPVFFDDDIGEQLFIPGRNGIDGAAGERGPIVMIEGDAGEDGRPCLAQNAYRPITDATASRALNTTYTNSSVQTLMVMATVRCAITLAAGNATVQGKSDIATPPTVAASGVVGIESGLLNEDNTFQLTFTVAPGATYIISSATTNGTATLGSWFEMPI